MNGEKPTGWGSADGSSGRKSLDNVQSSKKQKVMDNTVIVKDEVGTGETAQVVKCLS